MEGVNALMLAGLGAAEDAAAVVAEARRNDHMSAETRSGDDTFHRLYRPWVSSVRQISRELMLARQTQHAGAKENRAVKVPSSVLTRVDGRAPAGPLEFDSSLREIRKLAGSPSPARRDLTCLAGLSGRQS